MPGPEVQKVDAEKTKVVVAAVAVVVTVVAAVARRAAEATEGAPRMERSTWAYAPVQQVKGPLG